MDLDSSSEEPQRQVGPEADTDREGEAGRTSAHATLGICSPIPTQLTASLGGDSLATLSSPLRPHSLSQTWPRLGNSAFSHLGSTSEPTLGDLLRCFFLQICNLHWFLILQPGLSAEMVFLVCCFSKPGSSRRPSWNSPDMALESSQ